MKHVCHAINCNTEVKPELLFCKPHWYKVPKQLRDDIQHAYRCGQCYDKRPSREWLKLARQAINLIRNLEK